MSLPYFSEADNWLALYTMIGVAITAPFLIYFIMGLPFSGDLNWRITHLFVGVAGLATQLLNLTAAWRQR